MMLYHSISAMYFTPIKEHAIKQNQNKNERTVRFYEQLHNTNTFVIYAENCEKYELFSVDIYTLNENETLNM